jgi:hypothetical protein
MTENLERVLAFIAGFDGQWPDEDQLRSLLAPDVRFVERPNLMSPGGSERDLAAIVAGVPAGRRLLAWQSYEVRDHLEQDDRVVVRMRWRGELAIDAGAWKQGTLLSAWCVGHYRLEQGLIAEIEQHDCYDQPVPPAAK